jgi:hypothetical protein
LSIGAGRMKAPTIARFLLRGRILTYRTVLGRLVVVSETNVQTMNVISTDALGIDVLNDSMPQATDRKGIKQGLALKKMQRLE